MKEIDINNLVDEDNYLIENIPNDIIIVGKINYMDIIWKYDELDLSKVECKEIYYYYQEGESIKNHILHNSLKKLWCSHNQLTSLPDLPNSLKELYCNNNQLISLPDLPNSLEILDCDHNKINSLPNLPNSLKKLWCSHNQLTLLPNLPISLEYLYCYNNQLESLPDFSHFDHIIKLFLYQDLPIDYIICNYNLKLLRLNNKINIIGYPYNPIYNQDELDKYMEYIKNYQLNRIKSARK